MSLKQMLLGATIILSLLLSIVTFVTLLAGTEVPFGDALNTNTDFDSTAYTAPQLLTEESPKTIGTLEFPMVVQGTTLVAQSLALYEGDMIENGDDVHLVDAAALELRNMGTSEVELAEIVLKIGQKEMVFFGTNIPGKSTVLIVEQSGQGWSGEACYNCSGWAQYADPPQLAAGSLEINDFDMCTVALTNTTNSTLMDIWIFYKNYLYDSQIYIGGITYIEQIERIEPGKTVLIKPEKYASGYSKIIKVETYE